MQSRIVQAQIDVLKAQKALAARQQEGAVVNFNAQQVRFQRQIDDQQVKLAEAIAAEAAQG